MSVTLWQWPQGLWEEMRIVWPLLLISLTFNTTAEGEQDRHGGKERPACQVYNTQKLLYEAVLPSVHLLRRKTDKQTSPKRSLWTQSGKQVVPIRSSRDQLLCHCLFTGSLSLLEKWGLAENEANLKTSHHPTEQSVRNWAQECWLLSEAPHSPPTSSIKLTVQRIAVVYKEQ